MLWPGVPRQLVRLAQSDRVHLYTSRPLLNELDEVLRRGKFRARLQQAQVSVDDLVLGYIVLATVVEPISIPLTIPQDPEDDNVLACALAAADVIISGDRHLLPLGSFSSIPVLPADVLIDQMNPQKDGMCQ